MKNLIINADDFGYTRSINEGIIEAIKSGVITSTSLMVYGEYSNEIEKISGMETISIGLHFEIPTGKKTSEDEFHRQLEVFEELVGRKPDHLDSHKILPSDITELEKVFGKYSKENKTPIRGWGHAKLIEDFFGLNLDGSGQLDTKKLSTRSLIEILNTQLAEGYNELMCHAGYVDDDLVSKSSYNKPRELELQTLLSNKLKQYLASRDDISLICWKDVVL